MLTTLRKRERKLMKRDTAENIQYYLMMAVPLILIFIFMYLPMFGLVIAFQDYVPGKSFFGSDVKWVGLKWFKDFVGTYYFKRIIRNTLRLNLMGLVFGFSAPILFALVLNEVRLTKYKKIAQTVSYMPHFLSTVVIVGMLNRMIASDGIITRILTFIGVEARSLNANVEAFPWIFTIVSVWQGFGWGSILYLSTMTAIDPGLHEAAQIDGAGRIKRIWYVNIPELMPLITIQLIMSIGGLLGANTELILLMYNSATYESADVLGTYIYRESLMKGSYSYGTACGLLLGIFGFLLTWLANAICRKTTDWALW